MFPLLSLIFISKLLIATISAQTSTEPDDNVNYRLPNNTHPTTYDLSIYTRVDESNFDFTGNVKIGIVVDQQTREIVLHARQLTIVNVTLSRFCNDTQVSVELLPFEYDYVCEFLKIQTNQTVLNENERLILEINYWGTLRDYGAGFYRSNYVDADGRFRSVIFYQLKQIEVIGNVKKN